MNRHLLAGLFLLVAIGVMVACIAALKSNGATDHPLLVNTAYEARANMLFGPCPMTARNTPPQQEREA